jgi:hypothetical protein
VSYGKTSTCAPICIRNLTETETIEIQCGIIQGDSLLFIILLLLDPPHRTVEQVEHKQNITLYVGDLKLMGKSVEELPKTDTNRNLSDDIHRQFVLEKCAKIILEKGKVVFSQSLILKLKFE